MHDQHESQPPTALKRRPAWFVWPEFGILIFLTICCFSADRQLSPLLGGEIAGVGLYTFATLAFVAYGISLLPTHRIVTSIIAGSLSIAGGFCLLISVPLVVIILPLPIISIWGLIIGGFSWILGKPIPTEDLMLGVGFLVFGLLALTPAWIAKVMLSKAKELTVQRRVTGKAFVLLAAIGALGVTLPGFHFSRHVEKWLEDRYGEIESPDVALAVSGLTRLAAHPVCRAGCRRHVCRSSVMQRPESEIALALDRFLGEDRSRRCLALTDID